MKKFAALFFSICVLISIVAFPASAEGFQYQFLPIEHENGTGGPHSKALFMINLDTDTVVFSMNADDKLPMASLTKIMTYIVAYENIPNISRTEIKVSPTVEALLEGTNSSKANIKAGEVFTGLELLHMMMIPSGNDASLVLAEYVDGLEITLGEAKETLVEGENPDTVLTFVDLMNLKAHELGLKNTHFMNPHGLNHEEHFSTAREMSIITKYAMNLPDFTAITSKTTYDLPAGSKRNEHDTFVTTNKLLLPNDPENVYYAYANGIKTGSHNEAGYCIAASAQFEGYTYVVIALGSPYINSDGAQTHYHGEMHDARELFRWAFTQLSMQSVLDEGQLIGDVPLLYAWKKDKLQVVASSTVNAILPKTVEKTSVISEIELPENIEAPVKRGDVVGHIVLKYADSEIGKVDLIAAESVERSEIMMNIEQGKKVFTSGWFLAVIALILLLIVIYIILIIIYRHKRKRLRGVKRRRNF